AGRQPARVSQVEAKPVRRCDNRRLAIAVADELPVGGSNARVARQDQPQKPMRHEIRMPPLGEREPLPSLVLVRGEKAGEQLDGAGLLYPVRADVPEVDFILAQRKHEEGSSLPDQLVEFLL